MKIRVKVCPPPSTRAHAGLAHWWRRARLPLHASQRAHLSSLDPHGTGLAGSWSAAGPVLHQIDTARLDGHRGGAAEFYGGGADGAGVHTLAWQRDCNAPKSGIASLESPCVACRHDWTGLLGAGGLDRGLCTRSLTWLSHGILDCSLSAPRCRGRVRPAACCSTQ